MRSRDRNGAGHAGLTCAYFPFGVRSLLDIGITAACRHLGIGCLRIIAMLFICTHLLLRVLKGNVFYHGKRIRVMCRGQPRHLRLKSPRIHRQRALENASRDWTGDRSTMLAALNHCHNNVFGLIERSKAAEPGNGIFLAIDRSLRRSGFAGDLYAFQLCPPTRTAIFVYHFPKTTPRQFDLFGTKIETQITMNSWSCRNDWVTFFI